MKFVQLQLYKKLETKIVKIRLYSCSCTKTYFLIWKTIEMVRKSCAEAVLETKNLQLDPEIKKKRLRRY